ncbi:hypothetical protein D3C73_621400 [compost metagenome]
MCLFFRTSYDGGMCMAVHLLKRSTFWFLALIFFILIADITLVHVLSFAQEEQMLVYAVLFDFMLVIPFLYWLGFSRRKGKSIATLLPLPILGALAAWLLLPATMRNQVWHAVWPIELLIIGAEVAFIGYEIRLVYRFYCRFRQIARHEDNTGEALRLTVHETLGKGKLASIMLHDVSAIYYLLFSWKSKRTPDREGSYSFTYHRKTSQILYAAIFTKILVFESVVVHLLVQQWSHWAAWMMTIASVWLIALIWSDSRASVLQPIILDKDRLRLRYGLRIQADVPIELIAKATSALEYNPDQKEQNDAAMPLLSIPNVRIELKHSITVQTLLFLPRKVTTIFLALDEPAALVLEIEKLNSRISPI